MSEQTDATKDLEARREAARIRLEEVRKEAASWAFPTPETEESYGQPGMSKRLYIAVEAMKALISVGRRQETGLVPLAFDLADVMLEREEGRSTA